MVVLQLPDGSYEDSGSFNKGITTRFWLPQQKQEVVYETVAPSSLGSLSQPIQRILPVNEYDSANMAPYILIVGGVIVVLLYLAK